jgi:hypothetical protein
MPDRLANSCGGPRSERPALICGTGAGARALPRAGVWASVALASLVLAACSLGGDAGFTLFADPGKYQFHSCEQIAAEAKTWSQREQELKQLMDRADQGAGGAAVGLIAYKADYVAAAEELDLLRAAAREKKCAQPGPWRSDAAIR